MKFSHLFYSALCGSAAAQTRLPNVTAAALENLVDLDQLLSGSQQLQKFAYAYPERNRVFGGRAHNDTINFIYNTLNRTGYYDVSFQSFVQLFSEGSVNLTIAGVNQNATFFTYAPAGSANASVVAVNNFGCSATDYPPAVRGNIALISRGECTFGSKASNANTAGAAGAIIYNNSPTPLGGGTLGGAGSYAPIGLITQANGQAILARLRNGTQVTANLVVTATTENRTTYNVIAETKGGDKNNVLMLGGHTDSVSAGPGINDDGSGVIGNLNVALSLTNFSVPNAVRFGFWSAEEVGLVGSTYYVSQLNKTKSELAKVKAYLNFDMIASPNYIFGIYDGDGSSFNSTGPQGSAEIEKLFQDYFISNGLNYTSTAFDGRSDYGPFLQVGIPSGGLFTGAEEIKTARDFQMFGGYQGIALDPNYHAAGDNVNNLNLYAFYVNTRAIARSVATYATSFTSFNSTSSPKVKREVRERVARSDLHLRHGKMSCGHSPTVAK